jgi:oxygen-dependent protoporphyrinogen oxidase
LNPVVVVGAGPAGLAVAQGLVRRDLEVIVLERDARVGGRVRTIDAAGYRLELGPAGILDGAPDTRALLAQLGSHAPEIVAASPSVSRRYLVRDGKPRALPSSPGSLLLGSTLTAGERLAVLREPFVPRRRDPSPESVAEFARRRFGDSLAESLAQPMVLGVFGGDFAALELDSAFPALRDYELEHGSVLRGVIAEARARRRAGEARPKLVSFSGGMEALPRAIAKALGDRVRLGKTVTRLESNERGVSLRLSDGAMLDASEVVLATEPSVAASLLHDLDAPLAAQLRTVPSVPIASVSLAWPRERVAHALDGFGLLCPRREGLSTMGILFMSSIFPSAPQAPAGMVLLRCMVGGANDLHALSQSDEALLEAASREASALLGISGPPAFRHVQRWPSAIAQYPLGHAQRRVDIEVGARKHGVHIAGTSLYGVGVNDVLRDAARVVERIVSKQRR